MIYKERPKNIRACLFDMDGTLINTEDIYTATYSKVLAEYGTGPLTWDFKVKLQGRPGNVSGDLTVHHYGISDKLSGEEFFKKTMELQKDEFPKSQFLPHCQEFLQALKKLGMPMAVATSSVQQNFDLKTKNLKKDGFDLFDVIITGDNPEIPKGRGKPQPDIYLLTLKKLNEKLGLTGSDKEIKIEECLIFEDAISGVESGINAGSYVIWIADKRLLGAVGAEKVNALIKDHGELVESYEDIDINNFL